MNIHHGILSKARPSYFYFSCILYMYEGCPSKSWTFVIKRDCLSGILWNLYDMLIYIYDTFSTNVGEITV